MASSALRPAANDPDGLAFLSSALECDQLDGGVRQVRRKQRGQCGWLDEIAHERDWYAAVLATPENAFAVALVLITVFDGMRSGRERRYVERGTRDADRPG